jgi:hypothetical protein
MCSQFCSNGWVGVGIVGFALMVLMLSPRDGRWGVLSFWGFIASGLWFSIWISKDIETAESRRLTVSSSLLVFGWSAVVCAFVWGRSALRVRRRWRFALYSPDSLRECSPEWRGFRESVGVVLVLLLLFGCYEFAIAGVRVAHVGWVRWAMVATGSLGAGICAFVMVGRRWSAGLAEVGFGLLTVSASAGVLWFVDVDGMSAVRAFPIVFNALMISFALMAGLWVWLGSVWSQQLDGGVAWTSAGRMVVLLPGVAFVCGCVSMSLGALMVLWPRFRFVGDFDDSVGRVAWTVSGHLLLMLVLTWSSRKTGRTVFNVLAMLVGFSLLGLIVVRSMPLSERVLEGGGMV